MIHCGLMRMEWRWKTIYQQLHFISQHFRIALTFFICIPPFHSRMEKIAVNIGGGSRVMEFRGEANARLSVGWTTIFFSFFLFTFRIIYFQATAQILMFSKGDSDFEWTLSSEPSRFIIEASSTDGKVIRRRNLLSRELSRIISHTKNEETTTTQSFCLRLIFDSTVPLSESIKAQ